MAEIAFIFHWPPSVLEDMSLADLCRWHHEAVTLHNQMHASPDP